MNNNLFLWSENFSVLGASEASVDCFQSGERKEFPFFEGVAKFSTKILTGYSRKVKRKTKRNF